MPDAAYLLDVGHGSSTLVHLDEGVAVIDAAPGSTLIDALLVLGIRTVDYVLISHLDYDHMGGLSALLTSDYVQVRRVFVNSDGKRNTRAFRHLQKILQDRKTSATVETHLNTSTRDGRIDLGAATLEVLYPPPDLALSGPGGQDAAGRPLNANALSAVIALRHRGHRVMLLPGDIEQSSLERLLQDGQDLRADFLLFPHHGGHVGAPLAPFASALAAAVAPKTTFFSIGRGKHETPRPEAVQALRDANIHVACTQLSERCSSRLLRSAGHLYALPGQGLSKGRCCAGTLAIVLDGASSQFMTQAAHRAVVAAEVPSALCLPAPHPTVLTVKADA